MKKTVKVLSAVLAFIIVFSSTASAKSNYSFTPEELEKTASEWDSIQADKTVITLSVGSEPGEIRFSWLSGIIDFAPQFRISENKDMKDFQQLGISTKLTLYFMLSHKVVADGLEQGKTYWYSYTEKGVWSEPESFTVQNENKYSVLFTSDAQIGRSDSFEGREAYINDTCGWLKTAELATKRYPDAAFIISAGDQTEHGFSLEQYRGFLSAPQLRNYPIVQTIGNHDFYFPAYTYYSNNPNIFKELLASPAGHGYYFRYGDALYIVINSNDMVAPDQAALIKEAVNSYPDAKWRIAILHHSAYSAGQDDGEFVLERSVFAPLFDTYGIDVALSGHDHMYARTYPIYASEENENGTVYIQASTSSGGNSCTAKDTRYTAFSLKDAVATYTALEFDNEVLSVKTYRTDTDELIDSFEMSPNEKKSSFSFIEYIKCLVKLLKSMK